MGDGRVAQVVASWQAAGEDRQNLNSEMPKKNYVFAPKNLIYGILVANVARISTYALWGLLPSWLLVLKNMDLNFYYLHFMKYRHVSLKFKIYLCLHSCLNWPFSSLFPIWVLADICINMFILHLDENRTTSNLTLEIHFPFSCFCWIEISFSSASKYADIQLGIQQ